jgi:hypothetical protein
MNTGTAIYQGDRVYFTDHILNQWTGKSEYLIAHAGQVFWVREDELSAVRYNIPSI